MTHQRHDAPTGVITHTEPDDGDGDGAYVSVTITAGGHHRNASVYFGDTEPADGEIADALVRAASGAATMHSVGTWMELQHRLGGTLTGEEGR